MNAFAAYASSATAFARRHCVVTGGLGFIGSNVAAALVAGGARVTVIDALVPGHGGDLRNLSEHGETISLLLADIGDAAAVRTAVANAEYIFNIAGQVSHRDSMQDPLGDLDLNTRSQLSFLETVRTENPDARIVYTSTRQVYGRPARLPVDETHPTNPVDVNGVDKLAAEHFHLIYHQVYGVNSTVLRLTNVFGPRQCLRWDGLGFLPVFVRRALKREQLTVFGNGEQLRDCLYVDDVVDAILRAASSRCAAGEIFNIGHTETLTLAAIAATIDSATGCGVTHVPWPNESAAIDIGSFRTDCTKADRVLGWHPRVSFEAGLCHTLEFYRSRPRYLSST